MARRGWLVGIVVLALAASMPAAVRPRAAPDLPAAERRLGRDVTNQARDDWRIRLVDDEDLAAAAREHSEVLATGVQLDSHEFLRHSLSAHGVLDPFPYVFYGSGPPARFEEIAARLREHLERLPKAERVLYTHVGVGIFERVERKMLRKEREWFISVLLTQRAVTFSPIPDAPRTGERFLFEGEIHAPFHSPEVLVTTPDGNTNVLDNFADDPRSFRTWVRYANGPGEYRLEVLGRYDMGPRVLALCSMVLRQPGDQLHYEKLLEAARAGTLVASKHVREPRAVGSEHEAEATLRRLVNRDREAAGAAPLSENVRLTGMARAHSRDMRDGEFFAHVSPTTGRLADRADSSGIRYRRIGENIAIGYDVQEAQEALMRSPGHRMNLLDPAFTQMGVGVVFATDAHGRRRVFVTQNFLIPVP